MLLLQLVYQAGIFFCRKYVYLFNMIELLQWVQAPYSL